MEIQICQARGCNNPVPDAPRRKRRYCSDKCRTKESSAKRIEATRQAQFMARECLECKIIFSGPSHQKFCKTEHCNTWHRRKANEAMKERRRKRGCVKCRKQGGPWKSGVCPDCWSPPKRKPSPAVRGYSSEYKHNSHQLKLLTWESSDPCWICLEPFKEFKDIEADHVIFKSQGGSDKLSNLKPAHRPCNRSRQPEGKRPWETIKTSCLWCGRPFEYARPEGSGWIEEFCHTPPKGFCSNAYRTWLRRGPLFKKIPRGKPANPFNPPRPAPKPNRVCKVCGEFCVRGDSEGDVCTCNKHPTCKKEYNRLYRRKLRKAMTPEEKRKQQQDYRKKHPEVIREQKRRARARKRSLKS